MAVRLIGFSTRMDMAVRDDVPCYVKCIEVYQLSPDRGVLHFNLFTKLPQELILRIFSFLNIVTLSRCAQVCKTWNALALDSSLWKKVDLYMYRTNEEVGTCIHAPTAQPESQPQFQTRTGKVLVYKIPGVNYDISEPVLKTLALRSGSYLRTMCLRECSDITDHSLSFLAKECRNIETLTLAGCWRITDMTCANLADHCYRLKKLDLSKCTILSDLAVQAISGGCPLLEYIDVSHCRVADPGIGALSRGCRNITHFIAQGLTLEGVGIEQIATNCPKLKVLNLNNCFVDDFDALGAVGKCPMLEALHVNNYDAVPEVVIFVVADGCPQLRILDMEKCRHVSAYAASYLIVKCPKLYRANFGHAAPVGEYAIQCISYHCPVLCELNVSGSSNFNDRCLETIGRSAGLCRSLRVLTMGRCRNVTNQGIGHLSTCAALRCLIVTYCDVLTQAGTDALQVSLPDLCVHTYKNVESPAGTAPAQRPSRQRQRGQRGQRAGTARRWFQCCIS